MPTCPTQGPASSTSGSPNGGTGSPQISFSAVPWSDQAEPVSLAVECEGTPHTLTWRRGRLELEDHTDPDAERVLVALGGRTPPCLELLELWDHAINDGGFIEEWWSHLDADHSRRWWLRAALERLKSEGVQDFLYDLPRNRAARMCEAAITLPHPMLDRAAGTVVDIADQTGWQIDRLLIGHINDGVRLRARRAFVESVAGAMGQTRSAPLIPFSCTVGIDVAPHAQGVLDGRRSKVEITLPSAWLSRVWARGVAIYDGRLTVEASEDADTPGQVTLTQITWTAGSGTSHTAELTQVAFSDSE